MATGYIQKEILIVTSSKTSQDHYCNLAPKSGPSGDNVKEGFEEACWNGLPDEMPALMVSRSDGESQLYILELFVGEQTVCAELSEGAFTHDSFHTLNPYVFLTYCHYC
jgi:hypothetical protein